MACIFYIKKTVKSGITPIFVRIRSKHMTADLRMKTGIEVDAFRWNAGNQTAAKPSPPSPSSPSPRP